MRSPAHATTPRPTTAREARGGFALALTYITIIALCSSCAWCIAAAWASGRALAVAEEARNEARTLLARLHTLRSAPRLTAQRAARAEDLLSPLNAILALLSTESERPPSATPAPTNTNALSPPQLPPFATLPGAPSGLLPRPTVREVTPDGDAAIPRAPGLRTQRMRVAVEHLTLPGIGHLLGAWRRDHPAWRVVALDLVTHATPTGTPATFRLTMTIETVYDTAPPGLLESPPLASTTSLSSLTTSTPAAVADADQPARSPRSPMDITP